MVAEQLGSRELEYCRESVAVGVLFPIGTKVSDLPPGIESGDALPLLQHRAQNSFDQLMKQATREDLLMLCPLLARLVESTTRKR
jgi:hypothetical protein